jgi:ubiquinone/menaquinone biosynthesis C-methylase UbiE
VVKGCGALALRVILRENGSMNREISLSLNPGYLPGLSASDEWEETRRKREINKQQDPQEGSRFDFDESKLGEMVWGLFNSGSSIPQGKDSEDTFRLLQEQYAKISDQKHAEIENFPLVGDLLTQASILDENNKFLKIPPIATMCSYISTWLQSKNLLLSDQQFVNRVFSDCFRGYASSDKITIYHHLVRTAIAENYISDNFAQYISELARLDTNTKDLKRVLWSILKDNGKYQPKNTDEFSDVRGEPVIGIISKLDINAITKKIKNQPLLDQLVSIEAAYKDYADGDVVELLMQQNQLELKDTMYRYIEQEGYNQLLDKVRIKMLDEYTNFNRFNPVTYFPVDFKPAYIMKLLLGQDPTNPRIPVHLSPQSVYASVNFSEYYVNNSAQQFDTHLIDKLIAKDGTGLDLGCGSGRITRHLATMSKQAIGLDISDENLEQARAQTEADIKNIEFKKGDWLNTKLPEYSIDSIVCIGRSLTHTEYRERFLAVFTEMNKMLKEGGTVLFDLPDPNKGVYLTNRKKLAAHIKNNLGAYKDIPLDELLQNWDIVADGPDFEGTEDSPEYTHVYNRLVPQFDWVKQELQKLGFSVEEVARNSIYANTKDENVYFMARKTSKYLPPKQYGRQSTEGDGYIRGFTS